jgi:hypothetical protein
LTLDTRVQCQGLPPVRLAVACDAAFCFVYEDNLRLLREAADGGRREDRHPLEPQPPAAGGRHRQGAADQGQRLHRHFLGHRRLRRRGAQGAGRPGSRSRHPDGALRRRRPRPGAARGDRRRRPAGGQRPPLPGLLRSGSQVRRPQQARRGDALRPDRAAVRRRHGLHGGPLRHQPLHHRAAAQAGIPLRRAGQQGGRLHGRLDARQQPGESALREVRPGGRSSRSTIRFSPWATACAPARSTTPPTGPRSRNCSSTANWPNSAATWAARCWSKGRGMCPGRDRGEHPVAETDERRRPLLHARPHRHRRRPRLRPHHRRHRRRPVEPLRRRPDLLHHPGRAPGPAQRGGRAPGGEGGQSGRLHRRHEQVPGEGAASGTRR